MKISKVQLERLVRKVFTELRVQEIATFKVAEDRIFARGLEVLEKDLARERDLDREVNKMLDDLERQNPGGFERHKMFQMIKKKLAKEKKVIL